MQEEVTGKVVAIIIDDAKISEHTLEKALKAFLEAQKKGAKIRWGKQSLKQLAGQNVGLANIEITDRRGYTEVKINTFINAKRERGFSVCPRAALPVFF